MLTDVGDVPVQELRDCGVNDDKLMNIISESVKLVMEEVSHRFCRLLVYSFFFKVHCWIQIFWCITMGLGVFVLTVFPFLFLFSSEAMTCN